MRCGELPSKAVLGERVEVRARIFADGRPRLRARVRWRAGRAGLERGWSSIPAAALEPGHDDWWSGAFDADRLGLGHFRLEAWEDRFGTWRDDVLRRIEVGVDPAPEIPSGWELLLAATARLSGSRPNEVGRARLELEGLDLESQLAYLLAPELGEELARVEGQPVVASPPAPVWVERPRALFGSWYELFPRSQGSDGRSSGTLAATRERLPALADMGFDVVYLTPIHPVGRTGRRGPNNSPVAGSADPGSPWAIGGPEGGHTAIDPQLGSLADFHALVRAARELDLEVAMDYALQCSPDHPWVQQHPDWFARRPDGTMRPAENPPKRYDDIYPLDFGCADWRALWEACYQILEYWIAQGVAIFRVDNPHTKPVPFWRSVIERLRQEHPEVILLAEAFTRPAMMRELAQVGFSQSYTYFTWRSGKDELTAYLQEVAGETGAYLRPNFFVNTPDILTAELQEGGPPAFRSRLLLAATMSSSYGIYSGFEHLEREVLQPGSEDYLDSEKYQFRPRPEAGDPTLMELIRTLNLTRRQHPALQQFRRIFFHWTDHPSLICYSKTDLDRQDRILVVANLDPFQPHESMVHLDLSELGVRDDSDFLVQDLLGGTEFHWHGAHNFVRLDPQRAPGHLFWVRP